MFFLLVCLFLFYFIQLQFEVPSFLKGSIFKMRKAIISKRHILTLEDETMFILNRLSCILIFVCLNCSWIKLNLKKIHPWISIVNHFFFFSINFHYSFLNRCILRMTDQIALFSFSPSSRGAQIASSCIRCTMSVQTIFWMDWCVSPDW